jgi:hypothetical protein
MIQNLRAVPFEALTSMHVGIVWRKDVQENEVATVEGKENE